MNWTAAQTSRRLCTQQGIEVRDSHDARRPAPGGEAEPASPGHERSCAGYGQPGRPVLLVDRDAWCRYKQTGGPSLLRFDCQALRASVPLLHGRKQKLRGAVNDRLGIEPDESRSPLKPMGGG